MFPGTGYFKSIDCPFFQSGLCERPYCHYLHRHRLSLSPEPETCTPASANKVPVPAGEPQVDAKGHRLYLPPPNAPVYNPTPKALLQGEKKTPKPYIPSSLAKVAALQKPPCATHAKRLKPKEVLGDIGDLSSSDDEDKNLDVIGSILLQGVKSGVLGGEVSEFQHELIKNTIKAKNKAKPPSPKKSSEDTPREDIVIVISDDEESIQKEALRKKEAEEEERKKKVLEEERLAAKRILEEKEQELEELEKKRKVLENFYKKTTGSQDPCGITEEESSRNEKRKSKYKSRKRKRRKYSRKKSKRRRSSSSSCSSSPTTTSSSSSNSSSYSSSSDDSDSEAERRRHRRKRSRHKKHKKHSSSKDKKYASKRDKIDPKEIKPEMFIKVEKVDPESHPQVAIKHEQISVDELKIKEEPPERLNNDDFPFEHLKESIIPSPSQIKDEDLPESVKSFLDAMEEIDLKLEKTESSQQSSPEHKKHRSSKSRRDSRSSSTSHRDDRSKSSRKSSHRDRHSSKSIDEKKSHSKSSSKSSSSRSSKSSSRSSKPSSKESTSSSSKFKESSSKSSSKKPSSRVSKPSCSSSSTLSTTSKSNEVSEEPKLQKTEGAASPELSHSMEPDALFQDESNGYFDDSGGDDVFENQDEELRRIFEEHERQVRETPVLPKKKILPESSVSSLAKQESVQESTNPKSKKRVAHKVDNDACQSRPPSVRRPISATQQMLERFKKIQSMRENSEIENRLASLEGDDSVPRSKMKVNKGSRIISVPKRTVATTTKGVARVSHVPTVDISKPLIAPDVSSKVPSGIRQRYLDSIVDECLKIYSGDKGNAYARATKEEQLCCDRSKNRNIYLNVVVNCIKKLRTEASQAPKSKQIALQPQRSNLVTSHLQILAGKGGSKGSWSIEKPKSNFDENSPGLAYAILKRYVLSKEDQLENGYPMLDPEVKGKAYITQNAQYSNRKPQPPEPDKRRCDRCSSLYKVDAEGKQTEVGECVYHWGRLYRQRANRALGPTSGYYCCNGDVNSDGCEVSQTHITEMEDFNNMRGFVSAFSASIEAHDGNYGIYALDCEMCYTTHGNELTRVTVINYEGDTVYESLVKPSRDVIDYNTRFSGISPKDLENVTTTIRDVQAVLLSMFSAETILIGHSLESDLKALKLVHSNVVDTSIVFPHKMGPPYKRALKHLAAEHLKRIIQNDVGGHDSAEDALAALDLMKVKVKSDVKKLQQDSSKAK